MLNYLTEYQTTLAALVAAGGLMLVQLLVADVAGILARHKPGTPIPADSARFHFRASRAHANTNESVAVFIVLVMAGIFAAANPYWLGLLAWSYVACRAGHMLAYYANYPLARSTVFGLSLVALLGLLVVCISALR